MNVPGLLHRSTCEASRPNTSSTVYCPATASAAARETTVMPPRPGLAPCPSLSSKASRPVAISSVAVGSL